MRAQLSSKALKAKRRGQIAVKGALLGLDELTKKIGFQYAKFQQASRQWDAENLAATLPSETLRQNLQETIGQLLPRRRGGRTSRLVVFVDDLDRCEPEAAYRLLEGLKVYLTLNNCVFVLGLNQKAVEGAIASRLAGGLTDEKARRDAHARAASYLEKICQNIWHLPIVEAPGQLLCDFIDGDNSVGEHQIRWLRDVMKGQPCLPPNPRKLKGLANLVVRLCSRRPDDLNASQGDTGRNEMHKLLVVAYVHQFHHELYVRWQTNPDVYRDLVRWCRGETPELDILSELKTARGRPFQRRAPQFFPARSRTEHVPGSDRGRRVLDSGHRAWPAGSRLAPYVCSISRAEGNMMEARFKNLSEAEIYANPPLRAYLSKVQRRHGYVRLLGLPDRSDRPNVPIEFMLVPPVVSPRPISVDSDPKEWMPQCESLVAALERYGRVLLLGDPGTGKTTFFNYLAWILTFAGGNTPSLARFGWVLPRAHDAARTPRSNPSPRSTAC